jgi:hypothetical protein
MHICPTTHILTERNYSVKLFGQILFLKKFRESVFGLIGGFGGDDLRRGFLFQKNEFFAEVGPVFVNHGFFHIRKTLVRFRSVVKFAVKAAVQGRQAFRANVACAGLVVSLPRGRTFKTILHNAYYSIAR